MEPYLGHLDAETREEDDDFLKDPRNFVKTEKCARAASKRHPFLCGRKGAGKSAVACHFLFDSFGFPCLIQIHRSEYEELHSTLVSAILVNSPADRVVDSKELSRVFYMVWTYILHMAVFQGLSRQLKQTDGTRDRLKKLHVCCGTHSDENTPPAKQALAMCMTVLGRDVFGPGLLLALGAAFDAAIEDPPFTQAREAARELLQSAGILITIDTEEQYNTSQHHRCSLRGMCRAVKEFHESKPYENCVVKCFLPAELTEYIYVEDRAKYVAQSVFLEWQYSELLELIGRRYVTFLLRQGDEECNELAHKLRGEIELLHKMHETNNREWRDRVWALIAPPKIVNRRGWIEDSAAYLLRHTQRRPRECLCCMNHVVEIALHHPEFPRLSPTAIVQGIHLGENLDMLMSDGLTIFEVPGYTGRVHAFLKALLANEPQLFSGRKFQHIIKRAQTLLEKSTQELKGLVEQVVIRSGFVGTKVRSHEWFDEEGRECRYHLTRFDYSGRGNIGVNEQSICAMHPILADYLEVSTGENEVPGAVYHMSEDCDIVDLDK